MAKANEQYSDEEAERRAFEALQRALNMPYKPQRELVGTTDRARAAAKKKRKAKSYPRAK